MAKDDADFEALVALAPQHDTILRALRQLVMTVHPATVETVRLGDRAVTWGHGQRKMKDGYAYAQPHARHVNLGFYQGAELPDPAGLLEGVGKALRHVKIGAMSDVGTPALQELIIVARDHRRATL